LENSDTVLPRFGSFDLFLSPNLLENGFIIDTAYLLLNMSFDLSGCIDLPSLSRMMPPVNFVQSFVNLLSDDIVRTTDSLPKPKPLKLFFPEDSEFSALDRYIRRMHQMCPDLDADQILEELTSLSSKSVAMTLKLFEEIENTPTDYSNLITHRGETIDVSTLSKGDIQKLLLVVDDVDKFDSLAHIKSVFQASTPNMKIYYPEPFIASPSFIHNDLGFIHILQYQF
jgi:hypothetical protein